MKGHARLGQLRKADGHVDVRGGKIGSPAAAVAVAVVDEAAEVEPTVEVLLAGYALAEGERALKLRSAHTGTGEHDYKNESNGHVLRKAVSSARTWFHTGSSS